MNALDDLLHEAEKLEALIGTLDLLAERVSDARLFLRDNGADATLPRDISAAANALPVLTGVAREKAGALVRGIDWAAFIEGKVACAERKGGRA